MKEVNQNIMWVMGAQGTGKTTMANFFEKIVPMRVKVFDNESETPFHEIDRVLNGYDYYKIIVFSQQKPPELINGQPFNPILIKLTHIES